ncbi:MAG: glycosyltransferase family 4 protein [Bacteroidales bacterium]|nr:glycosyltransferase family 4 protein [Bacteroidales bacterium]
MKRKHNKIIRAVTAPQSLCFCREVMIKMRMMGYEMVAVTSPGAELDKLRDEDGFHCVAVPMERHISIVNDLKSLWTMIQVLREERPYMVHSMTPKAGLICMFAAWITRVPRRVHTFTGLMWPTATGLKRRILMSTDRLTCACATHVIPEGQGVLNDLKKGGITKKPMKILGYGNVMGVDMERFNPARFVVQKEDGVFTFLFVGRIVGDKGINELVEAFTRLYNKYKNVRLVLVGTYEHELDPVSDTTRKEIDTNDAINACGTKYGDDLLQMYVDADCFVMPSYREGFPNTVLEAGAMNLPSIVTDINGSREIIANEKNGLIVPSKNTTALYEAMERILTDDVLRMHMARMARPMINSRFEKEFVQSCQIKFYKEIM